MARTLATVKGLGIVKQAEGDFYEVLQELGRIHLVRTRDEAYARLQTRGAKKIGQSQGTWTRTGFEYAKGQLPIIRVTNSRLLNKQLAKRAVQANANGQYFHTASTAEYEQSLEKAEADKDKDPAKRRVIILPSRDNFTMDSGDNEVLQAVLQDRAKPYFEMNGPMTAYLVDKNTVDSQDGTLMTQLWFGSSDGRSDLGGDCRDLGYVRARGVFKSAEGASTQKSSRQKPPYTQRQLNAQLKRLDRLSKGQVKVSDLESEFDELAKFFQLLKQ
ncbi:MAG: hypothetical protein KKF56_04285 [Nanoarchaeota archaeon]|nr:hypothetical protein [Nanoarchaeota archaeon]